MADLSKFGVPLNGEPTGILMPSLAYRFRVVLGADFGVGAQLTEMTQNVMNATFPKLTFTETELHSYNSVAYVAGKHNWDQITVVLRDDITNSVSAAVGAQLQKQMNHFEQTSAVAGINYKFGMELQKMDGTHAEELSGWIGDGCWLANVDYSGGDYSSSEPVTITMQIRADNWTHVQGSNTNENTTIGGNPFPDVTSPNGGTTFG